MSYQMSKETSIFSNLRHDAPASLVVALVALPLCLGIALASGAPLFSGVVAGIVGGIVVGAVSRSPLSVSGPAAGLTVIVLTAIKDMGTFNAFLTAVILAGCLQVVFGVLRAGIVSDFFPASVIKGMLAAIGLILILKQIPHAVGYDADYEGDDSFMQPDGENTFSTVWHLWDYNMLPGALFISISSLIFLFMWDKWQPGTKSFLRFVPGPLLVVFYGVMTNVLFAKFMPHWTIGEEHLVTVPVLNSLSELSSIFVAPDFSVMFDEKTWIIAATLAVVASIETLLSIEAIDKLDPLKRVTPNNRELFAQGIGNITSGMLGGLPVTSVIVRSSANALAGARTKLSAISHGLILLICVAIMPQMLNMIPLSALAAVLISVGYKLTKPSLYIKKYEQGWGKFIPFTVTIAAIILTDLLIGIGIGMAVGVLFVLYQNYESAIILVQDKNNYLLRAKKDLFFMHKYELKRTLAKIPDNASLLLDVSRLTFIDLDNVEIINNFIENARYRNIHVDVRRNADVKATRLIEESKDETLRTAAA